MAIDTNVVTRVASAIVSFSLALCGATQLVELLDRFGNANWTTKDGQALSEVIFMIVSGTVSGILVIGLQWATYFGFLASWTGRGVYYLFMGCYFFPNQCHLKSRCRVDGLKGFDLLCALTPFASAVVGIVLLILRCSVSNYIHHSSGFVGQALPLDWAAVLSAVASFGMLALGTILLLCIDSLGQVTIWHILFIVSRALFLAVFGLCSLISAVSLNHSVANYFGFLYTLGGRGCFYFLMGIYTLPLKVQVGRTGFWGTLCSLASIISIIMGIVYLILWVHFRSSTHTVYATRQPQVHHTRGPVQMQAYPPAGAKIQVTTRTVTHQPARW